MTARAIRAVSPWAFFMPVAVLATPVFVVGAVTGGRLPLPMNVSVTARVAFCPLGAAAILTYRHDGAVGVRRLLGKLVDPRGLRRPVWLIPTLLGLPAVYVTAYLLMRLLDRPLPEPDIPWWTVPILLAVFLLPAAGEEGGWMGYAVEPLQDRWNAVTAALVLGVFWGLIHVVPDLLTGRDPAWIAWQRGVYDVALRVVIVWLYNNTGKSVLAAILLHASDNVSVSLFPNGGSHYDPAFTGLVTVVIAVALTALWGATTLARFRFRQGSVPSQTQDKG